MQHFFKHQLSRLLGHSLNIKPNEVKACCASFLMVFILMACYFILRPVRDAMASDWSDSEVSYLWNLQFFISAAIISMYGFAVSRLKLKHVVPIVYSFFAASFLIFYLITQNLNDPSLAEKSFYLWVSSFSLFHLSVFWSLMSDVFKAEQGKRLFAIIATGASLGAIVGPSIPALFAQQMGIETLMLVAAFGLLLVVPLSFYLYRFKQHENNISNQQTSLGGSSWGGFKALVTQPYLLSIAAFILLYVFISSFVYFEQKNLLAAYSRPERAQILGSIDWLVNSLTFITAFFLTSRLVNKLGMPFTLALLPLLLVIGLAALAFAPFVIVLLALQVSRRVGNYAITRPAREMLFTQVTPEERFKAKPVIDVVVYRGGDAVSGTLFALLTDGLGLGLAAVATIGAGISALWGSLAVMLGKKYQKIHQENQDQQFTDHVTKPISATVTS